MPKQHVSGGANGLSGDWVLLVGTLDDSDALDLEYWPPTHDRRGAGARCGPARPRATKDIDVLIDPTRANASRSEGDRRVKA